MAIFMFGSDRACLSPKVSSLASPEGSFPPAQAPGAQTTEAGPPDASFLKSEVTQAARSLFMHLTETPDLPVLGRS